MGISFGGKQSRSGPGNQSVNAGFSLLSAMNPQYATTGSFHNDSQRFLAGLDTPMGSILQGIDGVQTFDQYGNAQPVGSNDLPTMLPKIVDIGNYNTVFEKMDSGSLGETGTSLLNSFMGTATTSYFGEGGLAESGGLGGGGGGVSGGRVGYEAPPDIGTLTGGIIQNLPEEMQSFITNTLNASSPERVGEIMNEFEESMLARTEQGVHMLSGGLMDTFASQGLGMSGAAMKSVQSLMLQATVEANAQIAAGKLQILDQQIDAMQVGTQLSNALLSAGATEQSNLAALEASKMSANAQIIASEISSATRLQETLIAAQTQLEGQRLALLNSGFEALVGQSAAEEQARINSLTLPYELLLGHRRDGNTTKGGGGSGIDLNGALSAAGSIAGASILASDERIKENITRVGRTSSGFPLYTYNYIGHPQRFIGVMAQDIEQTRPDLVLEMDGIKHVDYSGIN